MTQKPSKMIREASRKKLAAVVAIEGTHNIEQAHHSMIDSILEYLDTQAERNAPPPDPETQIAVFESVVGGNSITPVLATLGASDKWSIVTSIDIERFGQDGMEVSWSVGCDLVGKNYLRGYIAEMPIPLRVVIPPRLHFSVRLYSMRHAGERRTIEIHWRHLDPEKPK